MNSNNSDRIINAANRNFGMGKNRMNDKTAKDMLSKLSDKDSKKILDILNNKDELERIMSTPQAQQLLKKFSEGK